MLSESLPCPFTEPNPSCVSGPRPCKYGNAASDSSRVQVLNFLLGTPHGVLIALPGRNGQTVVCTQMWWVGNMRLWGWVVKERWTATSCNSRRRGSGPQGRPEDCQRRWLLSAVPREWHWLHGDHLFQTTHFIPKKTETQRRERAGCVDISTGEGSRRPRSHLWKGFPNLSST